VLLSTPQQFTNGGRGAKALGKGRLKFLREFLRSIYTKFWVLPRIHRSYGTLTLAETFRRVYLTKAWAGSGEPFSSGAEVWKGLTTTVRVFGHDLNSKTALPYLLTSLAIAWLIHRQRKAAGDASIPSSFRQFVFPREVYLHPSAVMDYKFVAIDLTIKSFLYAPAISAASWGLYKVLAALLGLSTESTAQALTVVSATLMLVAGVMLADFGYYVSHYLMHKVPLLWHFHQTHHSAEVLTPVTVYRIHPVEDLVNAFVASVLNALGAAVYSALSLQEVRFGTILGVNGILMVVLALYFLFIHRRVAEL